MEGDPALQKKLVGGKEPKPLLCTHTHSWGKLGIIKGGGGTLFGSRMQDEEDFLRFSS